MLIRRLVISLFGFSLIAQANMSNAATQGAICESHDCIVKMKNARRLARKGHEQAQYIVGIALLNGEVFERNVDGGMRYLKKASLAGIVDASYQLAYEYRTGRNVEKNNKLYKYYLELAVQGGHVGAQYESAVYFYQTKNSQKAKELLILSARKEHIPSIYLLARILLSEQNEQSDLAELAVIFYHLKSISYMNSSEIYEYIVKVQPNVESFVKTFYSNNNTFRNNSQFAGLSLKDKKTTTGANENCSDCNKPDVSNSQIFDSLLLSPLVGKDVSIGSNN